MNLGNKLTVFQIIVCETVVTKIYFLKNTGRFTFLFEFLDNTSRWYKTKDYFPESAGSLNLSLSTLKD